MSRILFFCATVATLIAPRVFAQGNCSDSCFQNEAGYWTYSYTTGGQAGDYSDRYQCEEGRAVDTACVKSPNAPGWGCGGCFQRAFQKGGVPSWCYTKPTRSCDMPPYETLEDCQDARNRDLDCR